jgi:hypothetical protein
MSRPHAGRATFLCGRIVGLGLGLAQRSEVFGQRRHHVARPALQTNGFKQAAQVAGRPLVEIEIGRAGLASERELGLEALELDGERGCPADSSPA